MLLTYHIIPVPIQSLREEFNNLCEEVRHCFHTKEIDIR